MSIREQNIILESIHALADSLENVTSSDVREDKLSSLNAVVSFHNEMAKTLFCDTLNHSLETTFHPVYSVNVKSIDDSHVRILFKVDNYALNSIVPFIDNAQAEKLYNLYFQHYVETLKEGKSSVSKSMLKAESLAFIDHTDRKMVFTSSDVRDVLSVFDKDGKMYNWKKDVSLKAFLEKFARIMMRCYNGSDIIFSTAEMAKEKKAIIVYDKTIEVAKACDNVIVSVA